VAKWISLAFPKKIAIRLASCTSLEEIDM
jgi:hypothetical protein